MRTHKSGCARLAVILVLLVLAWPSRASVVPDLTGSSPDAGITVKADGDLLRIAWPIEGRRDGSVILDLADGRPLIDSLDGTLHSLDPVLALTVGSRVAPAGRPPTMSIWNTFFDNPAKRPFTTGLATLAKNSATVKTSGPRTTVSAGEIKAGSFTGEVCFTFFGGSPLVQLEVVVSTGEDARAFIFDLGLSGAGAGWKAFAWTDTEGKRCQVPANESDGDEALAVQHRMLACEGAQGSIAIFPPPHQFFFPVDITTNNRFLWLGAAWKSMPADLSRERLGERCLDLLDDMSNWGDRKYLPGEVDVFKIDHTSELYGHMNINYLRLPKPPRHQDGWQPVLDVLRRGAFFTTTGEILIKDFTVGGKQSGDTARLPATGEVPVRIELAWTFPLRFAEIISGDGDRVFRERIELGDTAAFGTRVLQAQPRLAGRKWVRFEAWDVAGNGAYTQPVWITH